MSIAAGMFIGWIIGFLLRPGLPLIGQLSLATILEIVLSHEPPGLVALALRNTAEQSFNQMVVGALLGGLVGWFGRRFVKN